jgi:uncharacterized protein HemY
LLAWTCAVVNDPSCDSKRAIEFARRAVASQPRNFAFLSTLGAALYRAARYEDARGRLNDALAREGNTGTFLEWLLLALAHKRLGQPDEASRWLAKATSRSESRSELQPQSDARSRDEWQNRLLFTLLRQEIDESVP